MEDEREKTAGDAAQQPPASDLAERLARRGSASPGVVDVSGPRRHYTRTAGWVAQKFSLVNRVHDRYGVADAPPAAQSSFVMRSTPPKAEDVDEVRRVSPSHALNSGASTSSPAPPVATAAAPRPFAPPSAEQLAARAVMLTPEPADSPTQTPGDSTASPTAPQGDYSEASSDVRVNSPAPPSGVRVRRANVRSTMHAGPGVLARVAAPSRPANSTATPAATPGDGRGVSETVGARPDERPAAEPPGASGEASAATSQPLAASVKAEPSSALGGVAERPALLLRKAPAAASPEGGEDGGAEPLQRTEAQPAAPGGTRETASVSPGAAGSGATSEAREGTSATASELSAAGSRSEGGAAALSSTASPAPAAASRDAAPVGSVQATRGVQGAPAPAGDATAKAAGDLLMRRGDRGSPVRARAEVEGRAGRGQLPLVKATAGPSLLRAKASAAEAVSTSPPGEGGTRPLARAKSSVPGPVISTSSGAAGETAPAHAGEDGISGRGPASQSGALNDGGRRAGVAVAGITAAATRAEAGMVWRRAAGAAPERANATSTTGGAARPVMRQEDSGSSTTTTQTAPDSAGPAATDGASAGGIDVGELTEQVIRAISRRMAVERERRGFRK